jgi:murein DD-endopeptidase MepM/ murein hydrolase activator NlpD
VNRLAIGTTLRIPPVDGIVYLTNDGETIQQMADKFKVSPYAIIDSEYNKLQAATPETFIPARELEVMIPGGVTKKVAIYWKPTIQRVQGSGGRVGRVSFGGGAGSCGLVSNGGGDGNLGLPLAPGYTVMRPFTSYHSGIDLARSSGQPVFAAGSGTVIFAGWSEWGYGNTVVIAHTESLWTLYGHMSRINVSCGQFVQRAAAIGAVGSTGNSTGPHLHFETRIGGDPVNPQGILGGF